MTLPLHAPTNGDWNTSSFSAITNINLASDHDGSRKHIIVQRGSGGFMLFVEGFKFGIGCRGESCGDAPMFAFNKNTNEDLILTPGVEYQIVASYFVGPSFTQVAIVVNGQECFRFNLYWSFEQGFGEDVFVGSNSEGTEVFEGDIRMLYLYNYALPRKTRIDPCDECTSGQFAAEPDSTECTVCNVGTFAPSKACQCTECAPGEYDNDLDPKTACVGCPSGTYCSGANISNCPPNTQSEARSGSLADCICNAGTSGPDGGPCLACANDTYKSDPGDSPCTPCPQNSTSPQQTVLVTSCSCLPGHTGPDGGPCAPCAAGLFKPEEGSNNCRVCGEGHFSATGSISCKQCPKGTYSNVTATPNQCTECVPGKFVDYKGAQYCLDCPNTTFSTTTAASSSSTCQPCPTNHFSPPASAEPAACVCTTGYTGTTGHCQACLPGTYKSSVGEDQCTNCAPGKFNDKIASVDKSACSVCPLDTFNPFSGSTSASACEPCTVGLIDHDSDPSTPCRLPRGRGVVTLGGGQLNFGRKPMVRKPVSVRNDL